MEAEHINRVWQVSKLLHIAGKTLNPKNVKFVLSALFIMAVSFVGGASNCKHAHLTSLWPSKPHKRYDILAFLGLHELVYHLELSSPLYRPWRGKNFVKVNCILLTDYQWRNSHLREISKAKLVNPRYRNFHICKRAVSLKLTHVASKLDFSFYKISLISLEDQLDVGIAGLMISNLNAALHSISVTHFCVQYWYSCASPSDVDLLCGSITRCPYKFETLWVRLTS